MHEIHGILGGEAPASMVFVLAVLAVTLVGCASDPTGPVDTPPPVASVEVAPATAALSPGETLQLGATLRTAAGVPLTGRSLSWSSSDTVIAIVSATGQVRAMGIGVARVRASAEGRWGEATITVADPETPRPALSSLSPTSIPAGSPGVTIVLTGAGFAPGAQILWNGTPRAAQWISSTELRLTLAAMHLRTEGTVQIAVRNPDNTVGDSEPLSFLIGPVAVDRVTVTPTMVLVSVGSQVELTATAYAANGSVLTGRTFNWTSSASATASVSPTGVVTGQHVGDAMITVESEGRTAHVSVSVVTPVGFVIVNPSSAAVLVNSMVQLHAVTTSPTGGVLTGRTIVWSSDNTHIATVDAQGVVTGVAKGTTRIRAESEGKVGWSTVEVRQYADGPVQAYVLRGVRGSVIMPAVGTTTWVDEQDMSREATLFLAGGELTMDGRDSRYEQTLLLDIFLVGRGVVGQTTWTDEGSYAHLWPSERVQFQSSATAAMFTAVNGGAGELIVEQSIGTAPTLVYSWVVQ